MIMPRFHAPFFISSTVKPVPQRLLSASGRFANGQIVASSWCNFAKTCLRMTAKSTINRELALLRRAQKTAWTRSGHKTDSVFSRYNIVSDADIRDAARKIEEGAKAIIHSSFIVEAESPAETERRMPASLKNQ